MHTLNRILQAGKLVPALEQALHARYSVHRLTDEPYPAAFLVEHGAQFDAVVTSAAIGLSAQHLAALPSVKVISSFGVGLDKVPVEEAKARGIAVGYTPDVLNDCVADTAFALLLDVARRTAEADRWFNALAVLAPDGSVQAVYDKHHLVPFGEYLPPFLDTLIRGVGLSQFVSIPGGFSAGPARAPLAIKVWGDLACFTRPEMKVA